MEQTNYTKTVAIIVALLVILGLVYYFFIVPTTTNAPEYTEQTTEQPIQEPQDISTIGEYTCLPAYTLAGGNTTNVATSTNGPCLLGLKVDDSTYYGLDFSKVDAGLATKYKAGDGLVVEGTRVDTRSNTFADWSKYTVSGVIVVDAMFVPEK